MARISASLAWVIVAALCAACGSKVNAGVDASASADASALDARATDAAPDAAPPAGPIPEASIVFPPRRALTDQPRLLMRGTASDDVAVAAVRVNNVPAWSTDGFHTWQLDVPLAPGENTLIVDVEDITGMVRTDADRVTVLALPFALEAPNDLALAPGGGAAYIIDSGLGAVIAVDLASNMPSVVSSGARGQGPTLSDPRSIVFDGALDRVLVADDARDAVLGVDLSSGDRSYVSGGGVGLGTTLLQPVAMAMDPANGRVLVLDQTRDALFAVYLASGNRTVLSDAGRGAGPLLDRPSDVTLDSASGRALVTDMGLDALVGIDLATGDRSILAGAGVGAGPGIYSPVSVALDQTPGYALVLDRYLQEALVRVDLSTGDRVYLSTGVIDLGKYHVGAGPLFAAAQAVILDPDGNRALVLDSSHGAVFTVDLSSGRRAFSWGQTMQAPDGLAVDPQAARAFLVDAASSAVAVVDLGAERATSTLVSDDDVGAGPRIIAPGNAVYDGASARLLFTDSADLDADDWYSSILAVDPASGDRIAISTRDTGSGPRTQSIPGIAMRGDQLFVTQHGYGTCPLQAVMRVDVPSGTRTVVSGADQCAISQGSGPALFGPAGLVIDPAGNRALVLDELADALLSVRLDTGERTVLSSDSLGQGPGFEAPAGIALEGQTALVTDTSLGALLAVDLSTGDRQIVSDATHGRGPLFAQPRQVAHDLAPGVALVAGSLSRGMLGGVYMVDLATGERVLLWY